MIGFDFSFSWSLAFENMHCNKQSAFGLRQKVASNIIEYQENQIPCHIAARV